MREWINMDVLKEKIKAHKPMTIRKVYILRKASGQNPNERKPEGSKKTIPRNFLRGIV